MKNVVLAGLLGVAVSQIAGCIFTSDDDDECGDGLPDPGEECDDGNSSNADSCSNSCKIVGDVEANIIANWTFVDLATNTETGCPIGFDTAQLWSQRVDAQGNSLGDPVPDLFECTDGVGMTAELAADRYKVWVEIRNDALTQLYAQSLAQYTDLLAADQTLDFDIHNDGGYFEFDWTLEDAGNGAPLTCGEAGATNVSITATVSGGTAFTDTEFPCEDHYGVSAVMLEDDYVVAISANEAAGSIGQAASINSSIAGQNSITDLGSVIIPIN